MKWSLEKSVAGGLGLACATLVLIGLVQYATVRSVVGTVGWVAHTDGVLAEIEATVSAVEDAETFAHEYALAAQNEDAEHLEDTIQSAYAHERRLHSLTADNPRQRKRLEGFDTLLAHRFALLNELVKLRRVSGRDAAAQFVASGLGRTYKLAIKTTVQELENEEYFLLSQRNEAARSGTTRALAVTGCGTLAGLMLVAFAAAISHRAISERRQLEQKAAHEKYLLTTLMDNVPANIFFKDLQSRFTRINKALARGFGLTDTAEAVGKTDADFFTSEHANAALADEQEIIRSGRPMLIKDERETWPDRPDTWVTTSKLPLHNAGGQIVGTFGIAQDTTARKRSEEALEHANAKLKEWVGELEVRDRESVLLTEMSELLQTCVNEDEAQNIVSQFARHLFEQHSGALCMIKSSRNLVETTAIWGQAATCEGIFTPEQCWALRRGRLHMAGRAHVAPNCEHVRRDFAGTYLCVPMMAHGEALGILHLSSAARENTEATAIRALAATVAERVGLALANLRLREALRAQSIRDSLTGLFNRRYMEESLERELRRAERNEKSVAAIMIDLDHFKRFNDTFGHDAGDTLLREFGNMLRTRTRKEDIACRYGGEEFIVILPDASLENGYGRAEEWREAVKHFDLGARGQSWGSVSASFGIALYPEHAQTSETLLRAADTALYEAKSNGRDRVVLAPEVYA